MLPFVQTFGRLSVIPAMVCVTLATSMCEMAFGGDLEDFLKERTVRVIVRGADRDEAASGFLWKHQNWVVTNLHAIPSDQGITVVCRGIAQKATVHKVLPSADLALLVVEKPASGKPPLHRCKPFAGAHLDEPDPRVQLWTYGWLGDASLSKLRYMHRTGTGPLRQFFPSNEAMLKELQDYGIPHLQDVSFYIFQGGSLPGYSGAAIVDDKNQLVAVVDGGLNEAQNTVKWGIPADQLKALEDSDLSWEPRYGAKPKYLWSTGIVNPDKNSVLTYTEVDTYSPGTGDAARFDYEWHRTKTLSLSQLARTALDRDGLLSLLRYYGGAAAGRVDSAAFQRSGEQAYRAALEAGIDPTFDIYEDLNHGLIIAVPQGQGLSFNPVDGYPSDSGYKWLESEPESEWGGHVQFKQTRSTVSSSTKDASFQPGDTGYFTEKISELLADCNTPGESMCAIDPKTLRIIRYENGNEILKVGFFLRFDIGVSGYDYYSFAVRRGVAFRAYARFLSDNQDGGLIQCVYQLDANSCGNPELALTQLSQMVAVHLTTFANLGIPGSERSVETEFRYDPQGNDPETFSRGYFEEEKLRFYNSRGKIWKVYERKTVTGRDDTTGRDVNYEKVTQNAYWQSARDADFATVKSGDESLAIPVNGGTYYRSDDGGANWVEAGTVLPR